MRRRMLLRAGLAAAASAACLPLRAQDAAEDTIARVRSSVVAVGTLQRTRTPAFRFRGTGFATGDGLRIATNAHVIEGTQKLAYDERLVVLLPGPPGGGTTVGEFRTARALADDRDHDLAVLAVEGAPLPPLRLGASAAVREGRNVYFTGFPIGAVLGPVPVTHRALVSAVTPIALQRGRAADLDPATIRKLAEGTFPVFQLDGTAYPGNSGSPVYESSGEVIAILNMVLVKSTREAVLAQPSGIAYAVPAEHLARLLAGAR